MARRKKKQPISVSIMEGMLGAARRLFLKINPPAEVEPHHIAAEKLAGFGLDKEELNRLPRLSENAMALPMEPMNLLFIGDTKSLELKFEEAGWAKATPVSFLSAQKALFSLFLNRPFPDGPVSPCYVGEHEQDVAFQKPTNLNTFRQRHHIRIWQTRLKTKHGQPVLIGQVSYDVGIKTIRIFSFPPVHMIDPNLDVERGMVRQDLEAVGAKFVGEIQLNPPFSAQNAYGDEFFTDGKAYVIEV